MVALLTSFGKIHAINLKLIRIGETISIMKIISNWPTFWVSFLNFSFLSLNNLMKKSAKFHWSSEPGFEDGISDSEIHTFWSILRVFHLNHEPLLLIFFQVLSCQRLIVLRWINNIFLSFIGFFWTWCIKSNK